VEKKYIYFPRIEVTRGVLGTLYTDVLNLTGLVVRHEYMMNTWKAKITNFVSNAYHVTTRKVVSIRFHICEGIMMLIRRMS
jgi:hypothetical protein